MELTWLAIIVVLATLGTSYLQHTAVYSRGQRIWADWAVWGLLALACRFYHSRSHPRSESVNDKEAQPFPKNKPRLEKPATALALLLVAAFCATVRFADAELQWSYPLTTLFTFIQLYFKGHAASESHQSVGEASPVRGGRAVPPFGRRVGNGSPTVVLVGICLASIIAMLPPPSGLNHTLMVSGIAISSMTAMAYAVLTTLSKGDPSAQFDATPSIRFADIVQATAVRAFALFTLYLALFSVPLPSLELVVLALASLRIPQTLSVLYLCFENSSVAASALLTASAAIASCFSASDLSSKCLYILVAGAALMLGSNGIQKTTINRIWILALLALPVINLVLSGVVEHALPGTPQTKSISPIHPIATLVDQANSRFAKMLSDQSKTLEDAVTEYKRRYGRRPPLWFDKWFAIAQEKEFLLIDEFDTIMESLEPFWGIPASTLRARYDSIKDAPDLIEFRVRGDKVEYDSDHYHAAFLMNWMNYTTWGTVIPDLNFMISTLDEPRVVAPYDTVDLAIKNANAQKHIGTSKPNTDLIHEPSNATDPVKWINVGKQDAWEALLSSCHIDSPARSELARNELRDQIHSLPFVSNTTTSMDVCASPDLLHGHGFFAAPESLTITHSLVPVFAQCKTSLFNDVLYPSPYYQMQIESNDYDETTDTAWDDKLDRVYWAGTATGGHHTLQNWMRMHRQRLTLLTASDSNEPVTLLQKDPAGLWQTLQTTWSSISNLFYLKITNIVQCTEEACAAMHARFGDADGNLELEPRENALGSKYALDIDGNTFSGRYYRLLKSNVAVLKHTGFKEWHDGRLVPWVHYIPVSPGAEEFGEMMRYLTGEEEGREIGRRIAAQGRDWARMTLRKEDLEVVFVRVLMEYAKVMSDGREWMGFDVD